MVGMAFLHKLAVTNLSLAGGGLARLNRNAMECLSCTKPCYANNHNGIGMPSMFPANLIRAFIVA